MTWRQKLMKPVAEAIETGRSIPLEGARLARYAARQCPYETSWPRKVWVSEVKRQLRLARMVAKRGGEHHPLFDGDIKS